MGICKFEFPEDMTVSVYNEERRKHHNLMQKLFDGEIRLMCDKCGHPVSDQPHVDMSMRPPMRQVVCTSLKCRATMYRYE